LHRLSQILSSLLQRLRRLRLAPLTLLCPGLLIVLLPVLGLLLVAIGRIAVTGLVTIGLALIVLRTFTRLITGHRSRRIVRQLLTDLA
jgi:hypothetical protein